MKLCLLLLSVAGIVLGVPFMAQAHRSGCHNLHTCPSDSGSYICGDLGYPCNGATSVRQIAPGAINVPLLVDRLFADAFGRKPTDAESRYWKARFRADKDGLTQMRRAMAWHRSVGSFGPTSPSVSVSSDLVPKINSLFRSVYDGRNPTVSENHYWLGRLNDKQTEAALVDAMRWHKQRGIQH